MKCLVNDYIIISFVCLINIIFSIEQSLTEESSPTQSLLLIVGIKNGESKIHRQHNHIANKYLKIWKVVTAGGSASNLETPENQKLAGKWAMQQNRTYNTAVVYFPGQQVGIYNGSFVNKEMEPNSFEELLSGKPVNNATTPSTSMTSSSTSSSILSTTPTTTATSTVTPKSPTTTKLSPIFYLEALVFINGDVYSQKGWEVDDYTMHALALVNYLDMLLSQTHFKINIAGLIYKEQKREFPFLRNSNQPLKMWETKEKFVNFLDGQKANLPTDSYDFVIYFTDLPLIDEKNNKTVTDFLFYPKDGIHNCSKSSSKESHPLIVTSSKINHTSLVRTAHQIYHMIGSPNYIKWLNETNSGNSTNCTAMEINGFDKNPSFKWTEDYCAYANKPQSLHPTSSKVILLNEDDYCWCHNYDYYYDKKMTSSQNDTNAICTKGFTCSLHNKPVLNITSVMKGTACGQNKVCWNNECVAADLE